MKLKIALVATFVIAMTASAFAQRRPHPRPRPGACQIHRVERVASRLAQDSRALAQEARYLQIRRVARPARELARGSRVLADLSYSARGCRGLRREFPLVARSFHELRRVFQRGHGPDVWIGAGPSVRPGHHHPGHGRPGLRRLRRDFEIVSESFRRLRRLVMSARPGHDRPFPRDDFDFDFH